MSRLRDRRDTVLWVREPRMWGHPPSTGPSVPVLSVGDYEPATQRVKRGRPWGRTSVPRRAWTPPRAVVLLAGRERSRTAAPSASGTIGEQTLRKSGGAREPQTARLRPAGERGPRPLAALGRLPSNALLRPARLVAPSPSPPPAPPPPAGQTPRGGPPPLRALASVCRGRMVHVKRSLR